MLSLLLALFAAHADDAATVQHDRPEEVMPDRHWDLVHLDLDLRVDPAAGTVQGTATHHIEPLVRPHRVLTLHQTRLDIQQVHVDGELAEGWRTRTGLLEVPVSPGKAHTVTITYAATPATGMHFRNPAGSADSVLEAWTQGEGEDNRHWFPGWDYPNDRFTYAGRFTVPDGLTAVSNGAMVAKEPADKGWTRWTYRFDHELVNYLVAFAAGDYATYADEGSKTVDVEYLAPVGLDEATVRRSLGYTPAQLDYFGELLGTAYPYPVYRQVLVSRFLYGAMENTTLTIMGDHTLQRSDDGRWRRPENIVAHELAHQWFGDLLTCYGWRELWLNEGFATYYAYRWMQHHRGQAFAAVVHRANYRAALGDPAPMAARAWSKHKGRDNNAVYTRGMSVLRMLEEHLGRPTYDAAIQRYVANYKDQLVESEDLRRVLEDASGTHLGWLFDQWVTGRGVPSFETKHRWVEATDEAPGHVEITIEQTTKGTAYSAPVRVEVGLPTGSVFRNAWLGDGKTQLQIDLDAPPRFVLVDPSGGVLAKWKRTQDTDAWAETARYSTSRFGQIIALEALGEESATPVVLDALDAVLASDADAWFRAEAARALGKLRAEPAAERLQTCADDPNDVLAEACVEALDKGPATTERISWLDRTSQRHPSTYVRGAAIRSLASLDAPRGLAAARKALRRPFDPAEDEAHSDAMHVLKAHGDASDVARLTTYLRANQSRALRHPAAAALSSVFQRLESDRADDLRGGPSTALVAMLDDPDLRARQAAIRALRHVGDRRAEQSLRALASNTPIEHLAKAASSAAHAIRTRAKSPKPPKADDAVKLQERLDAVEERLEELEVWK